MAQENTIQTVVAGASNFKYLLGKKLGQSLSAHQDQKCRDLLKMQAIAKKRSFSADETIKI